MKRPIFAVALATALFVAPFVAAAATETKKADAKESKKDEPKPKWSSGTFSGLEFRSIGPAVNSGRIGDLAIDPKDHGTWYVAVASGGVWKTTNAGTTFEPIFDGEGSYSIGCVTLDPNDSNVVWVGSGENNSQRSVGFGDGVYKSEDGGKNWKKMGLEKSEHIGKILVDPRHSNVVYVAAQGPLWNPGGERGLYKTTDGGATWKAILTISEHTGVSDIAFDPRNPDVIYATAYQRRRHVWTLINGGPEAGIHKSTDGGATWKKLENGLPKEDMGRIGIAVSPIQPDVVYALIEANGKAGGLYRSTDRGATWSKHGEYATSSAQYYQEIFADPVQFDRLYSMDTYLKVSDDGGKTWRNLGERHKHVDNHAMWIDPSDNDHYIVGCDGGIYESYDRGKTWKFFPNLPVTQFYRVAVDTRAPFYSVYGGTQDNESLGGPSRNLSFNGVMNSDWFVTQGGDGFVSQIDPTNPDIIYAEFQHGGLSRHDRKSGENLYIQPQEGKGEEALRWNWDSPLLISPHSPKRLYFAAQKLFRSDDRGESWTAISGDLTRQTDRNKLKVMGRVWSVDAVAKNASTSFYGNIVSLSESPSQEGLIYVGTDDGLVQTTADGGANWAKTEKFPGVPEMTYVTDLVASRHATDVVYAAFGNHKMGDYKPYVLKSADRGKSWTSLAGDLPPRGPVWTLAEDAVDPNLLFVGTEFGAYFSRDGKKWIQLKGAVPTIAVRDIAIQDREVDLVLGTFGRGFYILDDYSALRGLEEKRFDEEAFLFPARKALAYVERSDLGLPGKGFFGEMHYTAPNPPFGATFTYYLKDALKTQQKIRQEKEKDLVKESKDVFYPTWDALRAEAAEEEPTVWLTVRDAEGNVVRRIAGKTAAGIQRASWDLRYPSSTPTSFEEPSDNPFAQPDRGPMAVPGTYTVSLSKRVEGKETAIGSAQSFEVVPLRLATLGAQDLAAVTAFQKKTARLQRAVMGAAETLKESQERVKYAKKALENTPAAPAALFDDVRMIEAKLRGIEKELNGDRVVARENEPTPPSIAGRVQFIVGTQWDTTAAPTGSSLEQYRIASELFTAELDQLKAVVDKDLKALDEALERAGAPWTPGRLPSFKAE